MKRLPASLSRPPQKQSTENCVQLLLQPGVPAQKLINGEAFYSLIWEQVTHVNNGLYPAGHNISVVSYKNFDHQLTPAQGFKPFWNETAQAIHFYYSTKQLFAIKDDNCSLKAKPAYIKKYNLDCIMYRGLKEDAPSNGLWSVIAAALQE